MLPEFKRSAFPMPVESTSWWRRVRIPIRKWEDWSKNRTHRVYRGRVVSKGGSKVLRSMIAGTVSLALGSHRVAHNKLWMLIHVAKPNHLGDAMNVVDLVSDAVQDATGLDDKWYQASLTWSVDPQDPHVEIVLVQESDEDVLACPACGEIKPLAEFCRSRRARTGRGGKCRPCRILG